MAGTETDGARTRAELAVGELRRSAKAGRMRPLRARADQLRALERALLAGESELVAALAEDLHKPATESLVAEIWPVVAEARHARRHLRRWARARRGHLPLALQPARARLRREPLGVVLVVAPWNYPVNLLLSPLVAALAAGNCVVLKPSELAPATSAAIAELVRRHLDPEVVQVVEGAAEATEGALDAGVDHLLFTGSTRVGSLLMARAATSLTPVTLELGGKSPLYIDDSVDLEVAARRIAWGKFLNAGQTCIAPDYVLAERAVAPAFARHLVSALERLFSDDPRSSADYGRIVSDAHLARLVALLEGSGGEVLCGGEHDAASRYLAPTVLLEPRPGAEIMREEIFGPLLPIVAVEGVDEALAEIASRPAPMCAYLFSSRRAVRERFETEVRSGSISFNTVLEHFVAPGLPFGGIGASGTGSYHGRVGFERLSQLRPVLQKARRPEVRLAFPPYTSHRLRLLRMAFRARSSR
jgi:aldehyde dehydrogenase (NAD+)